RTSTSRPGSAADSGAKEFSGNPEPPGGPARLTQCLFPPGAHGEWSPARSGKQRTVTGLCGRRRSPARKSARQAAVDTLRVTAQDRLEGAGRQAQPGHRPGVALDAGHARPVGTEDELRRQPAQAETRVVLG